MAAQKEIQRLELKVTANTAQAKKEMKELKKATTAMIEKNMKSYGDNSVNAFKKLAREKYKSERSSIKSTKELARTEKALGDLRRQNQRMKGSRGRGAAVAGGGYISNATSMFATDGPSAAEIRANIAYNKRLTAAAKRSITHRTPDISAANSLLAEGRLTPAAMRLNIEANKELTAAAKRPKYTYATPSKSVTKENSIFAAQNQARWDAAGQRRVSGFAKFQEKVNNKALGAARAEAYADRAARNARWQAIIDKRNAPRSGFAAFQGRLDSKDAVRANATASAERAARDARWQAERAARDARWQAVKNKRFKGTSGFARFQDKLNKQDLDKTKKEIDMKKKAELWREKRSETLAKRRASRAKAAAKKGVTGSKSPFGRGMIRGVGHFMLLTGAAMMAQRMVMGLGQAAWGVGQGLGEAEFDESQRQGFLSTQNAAGKKGFQDASDRYSTLTGLNKYQSMGEVARFGGIMQTSGLQLTPETMMMAVNAAVGLGAQKGSSTDDAMQTIIGVLAGNIQPAKAGLNGLRKGSTTEETLKNIEGMLMKNKSIARIMEGNTVKTSMQSIASSPNLLIGQIQETYGDHMARMATGWRDRANAFAGKDRPEVADAWATTIVQLDAFGDAVFGDPDSAGQMSIAFANALSRALSSMEGTIDAINAIRESTGYKVVSKGVGFAASVTAEAFQEMFSLPVAAVGRALAIPDYWEAYQIKHSRGNPEAYSGAGSLKQLSQPILKVQNNSSEMLKMDMELE